MVNDERRELFVKEGKEKKKNPPTQASLMEQAERATYIAGYVWGRVLAKYPVLPSLRTGAGRYRLQICSLLDKITTSFS